MWNPYTGTTTIDGIDHASKRTACYAPFPWIMLGGKWQALFLFEAKKYIRLKNYQPF